MAGSWGHRWNSSRSESALAERRYVLALCCWLSAAEASAHSADPPKPIWGAGFVVVPCVAASLLVRSVIKRFSLGLEEKRQRIASTHKGNASLLLLAVVGQDEAREAVQEFA